jgi:hypothetical protein
MKLVDLYLNRKDLPKYIITWWYQFDEGSRKSYHHFLTNDLISLDAYERAYGLIEREYKEDLEPLYEWGIHNIEYNEELPYLMIKTDEHFGGSRMGEVSVSYKTLIENLGEPKGPSSDNKVLAYWNVKVYDPVEDKYYYGQIYSPRGEHPEYCNYWNVSALDKNSYHAINEAVQCIDNIDLFFLENEKVKFKSELSKHKRNKFIEENRVDFEINSMDKDRAEFIRDYILKKTGDTQHHIVKKIEEKFDL